MEPASADQSEPGTAEDLLEVVPVQPDEAPGPEGGDLHHGPPLSADQEAGAQQVLRTEEAEYSLQQLRGGQNPSHGRGIRLHLSKELKF